jgi:hypothetical protein
VEYFSEPADWIARPSVAVESDPPATTRAIDEFDRLKEKWERETANLSSVSQIVLNDAYQRIIGMGPAVLPRILVALRDDGGFWFPALRAITGENPVTEEEQGDPEAMRAVWIAWAIRNGHIRS